MDAATGGLSEAGHSSRPSSATRPDREPRRAPERGALDDWRGSILEPLLRSAAAAHIAGAILVYAFLGEGLGALAAAIMGVGLIAAGLVAVPGWAVGRRSLVFIAALAGLQAYVLMVLPLTPAPTLLASVNVCVATLLLGGAGMSLVLATFAAGHLAGAAGWAVPLESVTSASTVQLSVWLLLAICVALGGRSLIDAVRQTLRTIFAWFASAADQSRLTDEAVAETRALQGEGARARGALAESQRLQTLHHLGQGLAHRFNNTLTVMAGAVDSLRGERSDVARREALSSLESATQSATAATRDLLLFGRRQPAASGPLDLSTAVNAAQGAWARLVRPDLQLRVDTSDSAPVALDPQQLNQLVANLLLNAMDATPAGGTITVTTGVFEVRPGVAGTQQVAEAAHPATVDPLAPGVYGVLEVADSGHGLSPEARYRAFEPFFTTRGRDSHDGLGLSVALGIARRAGGSVEIAAPRDPATPGTRVVVYFPSMADPAVRRAVRAVQVASDGPSRASDAASRIAAGAAGGVPRVVANIEPPLLQAALQQGGVQAWRARLLERTAVHALAVFLGLFAVRMALGVEGDVALLWHSGAMAVAGALVLPRAVPGGARIASLVAIAGVGGCVAIGLSGSFGGESYPLLFISLCWAALSGRRRVVHLALFAMVAGLVGMGSAYTLGLLAPTPALEGDTFARWARMGLSAGLVLAMLGWTIHSLLRFADSARARQESARSALREALIQREAEDRRASESQEALGRSNRLEVAGRFVGGVAHDLNNVLQVIACAVPVLESSAPAGPEARELLDEIDGALLRAQQLVAPLGRRTGSGSWSADRLPGRTTELTSHIATTVAGFARSLPPGVTVVNHPPSGPIRAQITPPEFDRILLNLLGNARDAVGRSGRVEVRAEIVDLVACVTVRDDGPGISEGVRSRVFEPLFSTKAVGAGTGLGLYQSRLIAIGTGGSLVFSSRAGDTEFRLTLPIVVEAPSAPPQRTTGVHNATPGGALLLVDDEPLVRAVLSRGLTRAGFNVVEAVDAGQAMEFLRHGAHFDALCTDAVMPGPPAAELVRAFLERFPGAPVVVCSGNLPDSLTATLGGITGVNFVDKPIRADALARRLSRRSARPGP